MHNDNSHESKFDLLNNKNYYLVATKIGYTPDTTRFNTYGINKTDTIIKKLYLKPMDLSLKVLTYDRTTLNELNGVEIVLENLTDNTISKIIVTKELGNDFTFNIVRGDKYKITASRKGYESVTEYVNTDNYGGTVIIQKLYLADLLNAYLPLMVFFDNDRPDSRSKSKTTARTYSETYSQYIIRRDDFVQRYNKGETQIEMLDDNKQ